VIGTQPSEADVVAIIDQEMSTSTPSARLGIDDLSKRSLCKARTRRLTRCTVGYALYEAEPGQPHSQRIRRACAGCGWTRWSLWLAASYRSLFAWES